MFSAEKIVNTNSDIIMAYNLVKDRSGINLFENFIDDTEIKVSLKNEKVDFYLKQISKTIDSEIIFEEESFLVMIPSSEDKLFKLFIHRSLRNGKAHIQERINLSSGLVTDYVLDGISKEEYLSNQNHLRASPNCFVNFYACFHGMLALMDADPEDNVACNFLPCSAIVYASCSIAQTSGWMQDSNNYIGDSSCNNIYDENGNAI